MASINFPDEISAEDTLTKLSEVTAKIDDAEPIILNFTNQGFIRTSATALLTSWLIFQQSKGHAVDVPGFSPVKDYLARMNFFRALNLKEPSHGRLTEGGRFIPITLIRDSDDVSKVVDQSADLVLMHFDNAREFLPAFEWVTNEIIDNIINHSDTTNPGVVCAQWFPKLNRIDIAICDCGIGIRRSLGKAHKLIDDKHAISMALKQGITRSPNEGLGNGLAGSHEIIMRNSGSFGIWTGNSIYVVSKQNEEWTTIGNGVPGTGVLLAFNLGKPVALKETRILDYGNNAIDWSYIDAEASRVTDKGINIDNECSHTGTRQSARLLRRKILNILPNAPGAIKIDFSDTRSVSSSFLDELLARLISEIGLEAFKKSFIVTGMTRVQNSMANKVIKQRLELDRNSKSNID